VYASPEVTLTTPFSRIGIALEGVSSLTFPPLFGPSMTTRLLYLAETVPVNELTYSGLFAGILPQEGMPEAVIAKVDKYLEDLALGSIRELQSKVSR
jgi:peroxisomal 3,2-trans-enoyl-CoA isomerase